MALPKIQKIQLIAISKHRDKILETLQNTCEAEIITVEEEIKNDSATKQITKKLQKLELDQANVEFAIKVLAPYEKKKGLLPNYIILNIEETEDLVKNFDYKDVVTKCMQTQDENVKTQNQITLLQAKIEELSAWKKLDLNLKDIKGTSSTQIKIGSVKTEELALIKNELAELSNLQELNIVFQDKLNTYFYIIHDTKIEADIVKILNTHKFIDAELPKQEGTITSILTNLEKELKESTRNLNQKASDLKKLVKNLKNLKITYDYLEWQIEKNQTAKTSEKTEFSFVTTAWVVKRNIPNIKKELEKTTNEILLEEIEPAENEIPPVIIANSRAMNPFEAVTKTYGLPLHTEMDPTPFLASFFIIFFALCLTDAGYGIVMIVTMWSIKKFFRLPSGTEKLVRVLLYGGIATLIIGALFGGWFGLTADQVPSIFTYTNTDGELMFKLQTINSITDPLTVLILALGLGFVQILLGTYMKLVHEYRNFDKKEAILDTAPWAFLLTGVGMLILSASGVLPEIFAPITKWWAYAGLLSLILTQGRKSKSIFGKLMGGLLSLYGLVGYLSDILSYSRLLALGLATAIIGLAVNVIAALMNDLIPYVGWIFMIVIFVGGHIFNLLINAFGSFIHSGRLQFVEFFGKFMEGGGIAFKPFSKKTKYIHIKNN